MDNRYNKIAEMFVSDAITEKPICFSIGENKFEIKPPTLGKMQILSKCYLSLDIDEKKFDKEPHLEAMRVCESHTDDVCHLMSVATFEKKDDLLNDETVKERADFFKWNTSPTEFCDVMLALMTQIDYVNFINSIRLTKTLRQNKPKSQK